MKQTKTTKKEKKKKELKKNLKIIIKRKEKYIFIKYGLCDITNYK